MPFIFKSNTSFMLTLMLGITSAFSQVQGCSGQFKTFTIGGWGTSCAGNNPGCYRDANFDAAFPDGVMIGCGSNTFTFTSSQAVDAYLPDGGAPAVISGSHTDPTGGGSVLSSQLLAVSLAVGFDVYDPNFSASSTSLGSLTIASGPFAGMSIATFLQVANDVIGGCSNQYSLSDINAAATAINENFDNGTVDNGYVNCDRNISLTILIGANPNVCESGNGLVTITLTGGTPGFTFNVYKDNVLVSVVNSNDPVIYLNNLGPGNFSVTCTDSLGNTATGNWVN
jgi:hypothetical protein